MLEGTQAISRAAHAHTRLVRNLVQLSGGKPERFWAAFSHDGLCIRCDGTVAFYPLEAWISKFMRHLQRGYFDPCSARQSSRADKLVSAPE